MANKNQEVLKNYFINFGAGVTLSMDPTTLKEAVKEAKKKRKIHPGATLWERTKDKGACQVSL